MTWLSIHLRETLKKYGTYMGLFGAKKTIKAGKHCILSLRKSGNLQMKLFRVKKKNFFPS
jgi:hypothetical protein